MNEREKIEHAISVIEKSRALLGPDVADAAAMALQERLVKSLQNTQVAQQRKQVTVFFADVSGFTAMSETMDHEEVNTVINSLWARVDGAILSQGGHIDKHIGDAVMALFGAPIAREDDPERAVRAALKVQSEIQAWKREFVGSGSALEPKVLALRLRIGINTGPALIGSVGTTGEYTAIGDTVNLASRVETSAPAGGILISHNTYRHVPGIFDTTALDPITVKGKSEPVQVYLVKGIKPRSMRGTTRGVEGVRTRTIGRNDELAKLRAAFDTTVAESKTRLINIVAEAGTGKSRLLEEFTDRLEHETDNVRFFSGRATADMAKQPSALIREILSSAFEIQDNDRAALAREKLERGIQMIGFADSNNMVGAHFIGQLIGFDYSTSPHLSGILGDARQIRDLAFHYLAEFFKEAARHQTVVLLLEDMQWADGTSLDLLDYLLSTLPNSRLLIVSTTRAALFETRPDWASESDQRVRLDLEPLSEEKCRELVAEILQKAPVVPNALVDLIVEKADGSPFYVEELINVLIEGGVIVTDRAEWRVELEQLQTLKVPATLTGLLQARIDTLAPDDRETLQQASIVGRVFWPNVLGTMQNPESSRAAPELVLGQSLSTLSTKEMIFKNDGSAFADTSEFLFKNAVLHDVTYESVLLRLRRVYHLQVAESLIRLGGERVGEYAGRVGEHYEHAGELLQAADWYVRAGKQAQDTYAPDSAAGYYQKALGFFHQIPRPENISKQLDVNQRLGEVLIWQARYTEAMENYRAMLRTAIDHTDVLAQSQAVLGTSFCVGLQGDHREALEYAVRAEELARQAHAQQQVAKALWAQGSTRYRLGEAQAALALGEQALAVNTDLQNKSEMARCYNLVGAAYYSLGDYEEAERYWENALGLFQELGNRPQGMDALNNLGVIADARGDYNTAFNRYQRALEIAREIGHRDGEIVMLTNRGSEQVALGNYAAAEADLCLAIELAGSGGSWILPNTHYYLSEASVRLGKLDQAMQAAKKSLALGSADGAPEFVGVAYRALAMVSKELDQPVTLETGSDGDSQPRSADSLFQESLRVLEDGKIDGERARTLREWARYELRGGNREHGLKMWEQARDIFKDLGAEMEVERMAKVPT